MSHVLDRHDLDPSYVGDCRYCNESVDDADPRIDSDHRSCVLDAQEAASRDAGLPRYFGPRCFCGSRATKRTGTRGRRLCSECRNEFYVRFTEKGVEAMTKKQADALDAKREAVSQ